MPDQSETGVDQRTAVDKALTLLTSLATQDREIGVSELARRTALSKSTAFRLLGILQRNEVVERVGSSYRLGARLSDIGARVYGPDVLLLRDRLVPYLAELYELTHETVHLAVLYDADIVYVNMIQGHRAARSQPAIGDRLPAYCTGVGKVLLAFDHDATERAVARGLPARTPYTITDPAALLAELRRVRRDGIAYDHQEAAQGLSCVAAPIMAGAGRPVAALSVAGADHRFEPAHFAPALRRVAYDASRALAAAKARQARGA
jgi:DNA-binding IclR family transcriptional regulator